MTFVFLFVFIALQNKAGWEDLLNFLTFSLSGMTGGLIGGFVAGLLTMFALRSYAPSILWKHMSPTIRIWAVSGPVGMIISGIITVIMLIVGVISTKNQYPSCQGIAAAQCLSQIFSRAQVEDLRTIGLILVVFFLFVILVWFLTGMLAGWMVVRHVRRLEPGITRRQGWQASTSWGCGAVIAAVVTMLALGIAVNIIGP
jgi:flagellar biosynthesis protein FlhB